MTDEAVKILQDPLKKGWLRRVRTHGEEFLVCEDGRRYIVRNGIACFLSRYQLIGNNAATQKMYDKMAQYYNFSMSIYAHVKHTKDREQVQEYLSRLKINDDDSVAEICARTGQNLVRLNPRASYVDVDLSFEMLRQCSRALRRKRRKVVCVQAEPEYLPLQDGSFDIVYTVDSFNYANNRTGVVEEMLRVARSGGTIMICDALKNFHATAESAPGAAEDEALRVPADYVPEGCTDVHYEESSIANLYLLTFRKP